MRRSGLMEAVEAGSDKLFKTAFVLSAATHAVFMLPQFTLPLIRAKTAPSNHQVEIIYEADAEEQQVDFLKERLNRLQSATREAASAGGEKPLVIEVPARPALMSGELREALSLNESGIVDLNNLEEASGGDPVRLNYYSTVQRKIQKTASRGEWRERARRAGEVYVAFLLLESGEIDQVRVIDTGGTGADLKAVAGEIVRSAAPFPPFPEGFAKAQESVGFVMEFR